MKNLLGLVRDFLDLRSSELVDPFISGLSWNFNQRNINPVTTTAALKWLPECLAHAGNAEKSLVNAIVDRSAQLQWRSPYNEEDLGADIATGLTTVELVGPQGHFASDEVRFGFYLQGAGLDYPAHWHIAKELYIPLTSHSLWSKDGSEHVLRESGEIIIHQSNQHHAMITDVAPLLAIWFWRGGDLWQKPDF